MGSLCFSPNNGPRCLNYPTVRVNGNHHSILPSMAMRVSMIMCLGFDLLIDYFILHIPLFCLFFALPMTPVIHQHHGPWALFLSSVGPVFVCLRTHMTIDNTINAVTIIRGDTHLWDHSPHLVGSLASGLCIPLMTWLLLHITVMICTHLA